MSKYQKQEIREMIGVSKCEHALYMTSLCRYFISSAFGFRVPLGIVSNLLEILLSATDTGIYTLSRAFMISFGLICTLHVAVE